MKLFKIIMKFVIGLLVVALLALSVVGIAFYDKTEGEYYYDTANSKNAATLVAEDVSDSLDVISNSSYKDNKLSISLSMNQLSDILTNILRDNVNDQYLETANSYLFKNSALANIKKIYFESNGTDLKIKADVNAIGFYNSHGTVECDVSVDSENKLVFDITGTDLGKVHLQKNTVKDVLTSFKNELEENSTESIIIDVDNLKVSIDIKGLINEGIENSILRHIVNTLQYDLIIKDSRVNLVVDTSKFLTGESQTKTGQNNGMVEKFTSAIAALVGTTKAQIVITESNFNYLIKEKLEQGMETVNSTYEIGGKKFEISVSDPYFDITTMTIMATLKVNKVVTPITLDLDYIKTFDSDGYVDLIRFDVTGAKFGSTQLDNLDGLNFEFSIKESLLKGYPLLLLKDFEFNKKDSTVVMTTVKAK